LIHLFMAGSDEKKHRSGVVTLALRTCGVLALVYVALLFPEPTAPAVKGAGRQPFEWKQDQFWKALELKFLQARSAGCASLADDITSRCAAIDRLLGELSRERVAADDLRLPTLESNIVHLAPLIAACPQRLNDFIPLATRLRSELKKQSIHWDFNAVSTRKRIYRLLFGTRMAVEEVLLQAPSEITIPELLPGDNEPSQTPSTTVHGAMVHSGDVFLSRGGAPTSALIARGNDFPGVFSHVALLHVDEKGGRASLIESHIERGVAIASIDEYLSDKKLRILVLRPRADLPALRKDPLLPHKAAAGALEKARQIHIPYDFQMDYKDHAGQFCSEVITAAYEPFNVNFWTGPTFISSPAVVTSLASFGVTHFETQEPAELEFDPQLVVVAEWRDRNTLAKAHVDDAVTDAMLESTQPGRSLSYNPWLLPVTRLAKAYSVVWNAFGKIGPVPEGMSATTALRVKKYRNDHTAIANVVLRSSEQFRNKSGYAPPYWELVNMAREADHHVRGKSP
jgi:Permuted papain-like amidase enzyme, YaeF/YiiX, C92 family